MAEPNPVVELEDRIGTQLLLVQMGAGSTPGLDERYEILELRGRGARGVVCRARDRRLDRMVALKLYPLQRDVPLSKEVTREARALARLDHPNVVRVHDVGAGALVVGVDRFPCLYLSMELIEGRNLRAWRAERVRAPRELLRVLLAAGEGLAAAHECGMIHRDFKPENVMLDVMGRVRIVDFGLARMPRGEGELVVGGGAGAAEPSSLLSERLTRVGETPGTLEYMAPEMRFGFVEARSDQFSFAATLWESLTGTLPFDIHHPSFTRLGEFPLPRGGEALDPRLRSVLERALAFEPGLRFDDMRALLRQLRRVTRKRRRTLVAGLGVLVAMGVAGGLAFTLRDDPGALHGPEPAASVRASQALSSSAPAAPSSRAACEELTGVWHFRTAVVWTEDTEYWYGVNGYYSLEIELLAGCAARLRMRKTGDTGKQSYTRRRTREAETSTTLVPGSDGTWVSETFDLSSDARARLRYQFHFRFEGDTLAGDYRWVDVQSGRTRWKGVLRGGRVAPSHDIEPSMEGLPCASQCRLQCATEPDAARCLEQTCERDARASVEACAPSAEFVPPEIVTENLQKPVPVVRGEILTDPGRCSQATEVLAGPWVVLDGSGVEPRELALDLRPTTRLCELSAVLQAPGDPAQALEALVDGKGAWMLVEQGQVTPRWSLMGWGPAYGFTADGSVISAHKKTQGMSL